MNFRTLDLNLLRVFDEVMAERNLTRAARNLSMTQPAVSNALRRLRDSLGDELVVRSGYGVEPTKTASALWPAVRQALNQLREAVSPPPLFDAATAEGSFVLAMADATASLLMPTLVEIVEREAPGLSFRVLPLTTRDPRSLLETQDLDLATGYFPAAMSAITLQDMQSDAPSAFGHYRLYSSEYVCVMRHGHPLASQPLTLDAYCGARHLLVSFSGRPFGFVDEALTSLGRSRRIVLTVNQFFTAGMVVVNSNLLTVLPRHFVVSTGMASAVEVRELPFATDRVDVDSLWLRTRESRSGHAWLREAIVRAAATGVPSSSSS
ncbi:MAG: LysR family transcriptional regulator [Burkholderiales bacterium]|nr:LysR family transcriptional regulator [Burkholderiales bacterium]